MTTLATHLTRFIAHQLANSRPSPRLDNKRIDPQLAEYEEEIDDLLDDAINGRITKAEFERKWEAAALAILLLAFTAGSGGKVTAVGRERLEALEKIAKDSTAGLADDIYSGKYDESRDALNARVELWVQSAIGAYTEGQVNNPDEPNLKWVYSEDVEQHCVDCEKLNGVVLTADEWRRIGVKPKDSSLSCGGWRCACIFFETDEPSIGIENVPT